MGAERKKAVIDGLKPGDRVMLNEGGYEIIVGMPSDAPDPPPHRTIDQIIEEEGIEVDDSEPTSEIFRRWFE